MNKIPSIKVQAYWESLVQEHNQSGQGVDAFCAQRGICSTSFYARRKQLRLMNQPKLKSGFIQFLKKHNTDGVKNSMIPERLPLKLDDRPTALPVRIQTPNGYSVEAVISGLTGLSDVFGLLKRL